LIRNRSNGLEASVIRERNEYGVRKYYP